MKPVNIITAVCLFTAAVYAQEMPGLKNYFQTGIDIGYCVQGYNPAGLNTFIENYNITHSSSQSEAVNTFGRAVGYKFGVNVLRISKSNLLIGFNVFFQSVREVNESLEFLPVENCRNEFDLKLTSWAVGASISYVLSRNFDLKISALHFTFNSARLLQTYTTNGTKVTEALLKSEKMNIGFTHSVGIIYYLVPPYLAFDGSIGYSFFSIGRMKYNDGNYLTQTADSKIPMEKFLDGGGFFGVLQVKLSVPFK